MRKTIVCGGPAIAVARPRSQRALKSPPSHQPKVPWRVPLWEKHPGTASNQSNESPPWEKNLALSCRKKKIKGLATTARDPFTTLRTQGYVFQYKCNFFKCMAIIRNLLWVMCTPWIYNNVSNLGVNSWNKLWARVSFGEIVKIVGFKFWPPVFSSLAYMIVLPRRPDELS